MNDWFICHLMRVCRMYTLGQKTQTFLVRTHCQLPPPKGCPDPHTHGTLWVPAAQLLPRWEQASGGSSALPL